MPLYAVALPHSSSPLHAATRLALQGHERRHRRAPPRWQLAHPLSSGGCAPHSHCHGGPDREVPLGVGPALGRPPGAGAPGHLRLPVHPPLPGRQRAHGTAADLAVALSLRLCGGPLLDYFWGALPRAYKEFEERVGTIERGRGAKGDRVRSEILKRRLPFSISEIEAACPGISRDMVRVVLRAMKAEGVIAPTGKGRAAKWMQTGLQSAPAVNEHGPGKHQF